MEEEGHATQTDDEKKDQAVSLQLMQMSMREQEKQREEEKKEEEEKKAKGDDPGYVSSGIESDNDLDLIVEQEALRTTRQRAGPKKQRKFAERGEVPSE